MTSNPDRPARELVQARLRWARACLQVLTSNWPGSGIAIAEHCLNERDSTLRQLHLTWCDGPNTAQVRAVLAAVDPAAHGLPPELDAQQWWQLHRSVSRAATMAACAQDPFALAAWSTSRHHEMEAGLDLSQVPPAALDVWRRLVEENPPASAYMRVGSRVFLHYLDALAPRARALTVAAAV